MVPRGPNRKLAGLLAESGWSAGELARAVNALGTKHGLRLRYDRTSVAHWLEGSRPRMPVPGLVAQVLGRRIGRRVTVMDTGLSGAGPARSPRDAGLAAADPVERMIALSRAETDPVRRLQLNREMAGAEPVALPDWPRDRGAPGQDTPGGARLADMTAVFADLIEKYGGAHARSALAAYLAEDVARLLVAVDGRDTPDRAVLAGSAHLMHLLGAMAADAGLPNLGHHCFRSALALARQAGHRPTFAITLRAMAMLALGLDDAENARQWSDGAVEAAGPAAPPAVRAYVLAGRAVVRAADGRRREALDDLLDAESHHAAADGPPGPFTCYPITALHYQRAEVLVALGDREQAVAAYEASLRTRPPEHHMALVLVHSRLAETLLVVGALDAALAHCRHALAHHPHTASRRATTALTSVRRSLAPYRRRPGVQEVRDQLVRACADDGGGPRRAVRGT